MTSAIPPQRIATGLYISNEYTACVKDYLVSCNVRNLINTGYPQSNSHFTYDRDFNYISLDVTIDEEDTGFLKECLTTCFTFIDSAIENGESCLVYCRGGSSRSGTIVVGYLMYRYRCSLRESYQHVVAVRPKAMPTLYQMSCLVDMEIELVGSSTMQGSSLSNIRVLTPHIADVINNKCCPRLVEMILHKYGNFLEQKLLQSLKSWNWSEWNFRENMEIEQQNRPESEKAQNTNDSNDTDDESDDDRISYRLLDFVRSDIWLEILRMSIYNHIRTISLAFSNKLISDKMKNTEKLIKLLSFVKHHVTQIKSLCGVDYGIAFALSQGFSAIWTDSTEDICTFISEYLYKMICFGTFTKMKLDQVQLIMHDIVRLLSFSRLPKQHEIIEKMFLLDYANRVMLDSEFDSIFLEQLTRASDIPYLGNLAKILTNLKNDLTISKQITADYQQTQLYKSLNFKFSVSLLKADYWPKEFLTGKSEQQNGLQDSIAPCLLSSTSAVAWTNFKKYFNQNYNQNQSLQLLPNLGEAEILYNTCNGSITLQVDTAQMIVLELFNEETKLSFEQLATNSALPNSILEDVLGSLVKTRVGCTGGILTKDSQNYTLNGLFKSKKKKVNLSRSELQSKIKQT